MALRCPNPQQRRMVSAGATGGALSRLRCTGDVNGSSFAHDTAEHGGGLNLVRARVGHISNNSFTGEQVRAYDTLIEILLYLHVT